MPDTGCSDLTAATRDIGSYPMGYYNWERPHAYNDGLALAVAEEKWAICILGLEFIHFNPRLLVGQKAASGWIFLFFTTLRESNIGWIL